MVNIPIRDIPGDNGVPTKTTLLAMDDGITMKKTTVQAVVEAGRSVASQSEAEAGSDNTNVMTSLRVKQSIASEVGVSLASYAQGLLAASALQPADIGETVQAYSAVLQATTASFTTGDETKLDGIEALADVTDAANVAAAGAVMESDLGASGALLIALDTLGTAGQVVAVNGAGDDVEWVDQTGGAATPSTVPQETRILSGVGAETPRTPQEAKERYNIGAGWFFDQDVYEVFDGGTPANDATSGTSASLTFTRVDPKYSMGANGKFQSILANTPAYRHLKGVKLGLDIGDNAENLLPNSNAPASWDTQTNVTVTADGSEEIFEGITCKQIIPNTTVGNHDLRDNSISYTSGTQYCFSFIMKAVDYKWAQFVFPSTAFTAPTIRMNLENGAIQRVFPDTNEYGSEYLGRGYYRFWIVATATATASSSFILRVMNDAEETSFAGNDSDHFLFGHMQIASTSSSQAARPRTPIVTAASSVSILDDRAQADLPSGFICESMSIMIRVEDVFKAPLGGRPLVVTDGTQEIKIAIDNVTSDIRLQTNLSGATDIYSKRIFPEKSECDIRVDVGGSEFGTPYIALYVNGEFQGSRVTNALDLTGDWTVYFGRDNASVSQMLFGVVKHVFISPEILPKPTRFVSTITAVGPSYTFEDIYGVPDSSFYPAVVGRHFGNNCKVYNLGASGLNTMQMLNNIQPALDTYPDIAFIDTGNYEATTVASGSTASVVNLTDASKFAENSWIVVDVSGTDETVKITDLTGSAATVAPALSGTPSTGASVAEGTARNVQEMAELFSDGGALVVALGFPFQNFSTGGDTLTTQPTRLDDRERVQAGVLAAQQNGAFVVYNDQYEYFRQRIIAGLDVLGDFKGHIADGDPHLNVYGQRYQRADGIILQLRALGFAI